ncbi:hypothetical protein [uncultured Pseudoteredinibacter sp.]|uniref:ankyrin repeat domain-containing protein n=1 Tax=uncultured Pseudoteredinibacter sp. TaxID=1641701 RepID=UPI0026332102|nr:hypothetical protein [uncultured Pseudoteredinibacter sp.]
MRQVLKSCCVLLVLCTAWESSAGVTIKSVDKAVNKAINDALDNTEVDDRLRKKFRDKVYDHYGLDKRVLTPECDRAIDDLMKKIMPGGSLSQEMPELSAAVNCKVPKVNRKKRKELSKSLWFYVHLRKNCDASKLEEYLAKGADPNQIQVLKTGQSALHMAAQYCTNKEVETLLKWGGAPNMRDKNGQTPLFWQMENFNYQGYYSFVKNHFAIKSVNALIAAGADPKHIRDNGDNILHAFLKSEKPFISPSEGPSIIEHLAKFADINHLDASGARPLDSAVRFKPELAQEVYRLGGSSEKPETWRNYPMSLGEAAIQNLAKQKLPLPLHDMMANTAVGFLEAGRLDRFDKGSIDNFYQLALLFGYPSAAQEFLSYGADPSREIYQEGPLYFLIFNGKTYESQKLLDQLKALIKAGADPHVFDSEGLSPLGYALKHEMEGAVSLFLQNDIRVLNREGDSHHPHRLIWLFAALLFLAICLFFYRKELMTLLANK